MTDNLDKFWEEMERDTRTPEQKAHSKGYTEGYLACEAEQRRKAGLLAKYTQDSILPLWEKMIANEPLNEEEAKKVWQEVDLLLEKHHTNGSLLLGLYEQLIRELSKGERCAVCGRYKNSDCGVEC